MNLQPDHRNFGTRPNWPLATIWIVATSGILVDRFLGLVQPVLAAGAAIVILVAWFATARHSRRAKSAGWLLLASIFFAMAAWHHVYWQWYPSNHVALRVIEKSAPELAAIRGRMIGIPESAPLPNVDPLATVPQGVKTVFRISATHVRDRHEWIPATGKVKVRVDGHLPGFGVGDHVQVFGALSTPPAPMNPGQSDARMADRSERILCRLDVSYPACVTLLEPTGPAVFSQVGRLRAAGLGLLDTFLGPSQGELAGALLLGARDRLDAERVEKFFHTGTIHLLAISGLHVGILAWVFFVFARNVAARTWILLLLMCLTVVYCMLTGMRPPVLRAVILVQVVCVGLVLRRRILAWNALAAAAVLLLVVRPASLFRPGTQLSFLAVATLVWLSANLRVDTKSNIERLVDRTRAWYERIALQVASRGWQLAIAGFAIWLVTMPLVTHWFHLLSPVSLGLNVVLSIPVATALLTGFVVLLFGSIARPVAVLAGLLCDRSLAFFETIVVWTHDIPYSWFWVAGPTRSWCISFYIGLGALLGLTSGKSRRTWAIAGLAFWLAAPPAVNMTQRFVQQFSDDSRELRCTFLSVGHGTCVVIEFPNDRVMLYDCGRMGVPETGVRLVSEFLWHRRITHIDGMLFSHADADHYNIFPGLRERFSVGEVLASNFMFPEDGNLSSGVAVLKNSIDEHKIPIRELRANDRIQLGGATLRVLHPLEHRVHGSDNANSVVVEIEYQGRKILLPGDLEARGLEDVMSEQPRDVDLVMGPHHGSPRSSPMEFLRWCTPEVVVVSGGQGKMTDSTRALFEQDGRELLHTAEVGAVTVTIENGELEVETFLEPTAEPEHTVSNFAKPEEVAVQSGIPSLPSGFDR